MQVVAINGSPRKNGNTAQLLQTVCAKLNTQGVETETIQLGTEPLRGCVDCGVCKKEKNSRCVYDDDPLNTIVAQMNAADGILLGSPTYFSNVTTNMKSLMDRAGRVSRVSGFTLRRKVGAPVVAMRRAGGTHVFSSINYFFLISQMIVPGSSYWNLACGLQEGDVMKDAEGVKTMELLGENMAWLLKKLRD